MTDMKVAGSLIVITAASLLGAVAAKDMDAQYEEMRYISQLLMMLQSEIRYSRSFLSEAFLQLSKTARPPYDAWLRQMYHRMERKSSGSFETVWKKTMDEYMGSLKLPARIRERISLLGKYLGGADIQLQIQQIQLVNEEIQQEMKLMWEGLTAKKKLCICLGVMGGIFLAVMLL